MTSLPPLSETLESQEKLKEALEILFEPSPILADTLVPQLYTRLKADGTKTPETYLDLIDLASKELHDWEPLAQSSFIDSHPRIGEVKNLSALSEKEQASAATPPEVLARLEHLNAMYETRFTGLKYVVFVNGRSRAQIVPLIEATLGIGPAEPGHEKDPSLESIIPLEAEDEEWNKELQRALKDVVLIAKARLKALAAQ